MLSPADFIYNGDYNEDYVEFSTDLDSKDAFNAHYNNANLNVSGRYIGDSLSANSIAPKDFLASYQKYIPNLFSNTQIEHDLLLPGVRYMSEGIIVFERFPTHKVIDISKDFRDNINDETSSMEYYLPIPWQVYVATYNPEDMRLVSVKMFFTDTSLRSMDQNLYVPPIFNFYSNGTLCRPFFASMEDIEKYPKTHSGVIASAYDWIWNSGFNYDITENISQYIFSKKYQSMEPYIKSKSTLSAFNILKNNSLSYLPKLIDPAYVKNLYTVWQDVPLADISNVSWNSYTYSDFFYQEYDYLKDQAVDVYLQTNGLSLLDNDCDCDECYPDGYPDDQISIEDVYNDSQYGVILRDLVSNTDKPLYTAIRTSIEFAKNNRIIGNRKFNLNSMIGFRDFQASFFSEISEKEPF